MESEEGNIEDVRVNQSQLSSTVYVAMADRVDETGEFSYTSDWDEMEFRLHLLFALFAGVPQHGLDGGAVCHPHRRPSTITISPSSSSLPHSRSLVWLGPLRTPRADHA